MAFHRHAATRPSSRANRLRETRSAPPLLARVIALARDCRSKPMTDEMFTMASGPLFCKCAEKKPRVEMETRPSGSCFKHRVPVRITHCASAKPSPRHPPPLFTRMSTLPQSVMIFFRRRRHRVCHPPPIHRQRPGPCAPTRGISAATFSEFFLRARNHDDIRTPLRQISRRMAATDSTARPG